jgi:hypothetical protein
VVNRTDLQRLAQTRLDDALLLLGGCRWPGAYYLAGYAIECGLKACLLRHLGESGALFGEQDYLKKKLVECFTHDLVKLMNMAGLEPDFGRACGSNLALNGYWGLVKDWKETSRYQEKTEAEARALCEAVSPNPDGVFRWIQTRW